MWRNGANSAIDIRTFCNSNSNVNSDVLFRIDSGASRYEYLDEDSPDPEDSDPPGRGPSLSVSPPVTPTSTPAAAAPGPASPPGTWAGRTSRSGWDTAVT
jgi:hypothetical protein